MNKKVYIPQVCFKWADGEFCYHKSDGCMVWYYSFDQARKYFPDEEILEVEMFFPKQAPLN